MNQIYIPYWEWEEWKAGMWRKLNKNEEPNMLDQAIQFTGNWSLYGAAMKRVVYEWPRTMLNTLTNPSVNQRAFVGHCACQLEFNCPEYITRAAWKELTDRQRWDADAIAQKVIDNWKIEYANKIRGLRKAVGEQVLF